MHQHLLLNLAEMWLCLIFQTLPRFQFDQYTPANIEKGWASHHLNIALPLWQSYREVEDPDIWDERAKDIGKESFKQFLFSPDPEIRLWAEGLREAFHSLRDSGESRIREYYNIQIRKWRETGRIAKSAKTNERWQNWYAEGTKVVVNAHDKTGNTYHFSVGGTTFMIAASLGLRFDEGAKVHVRFEITDGPLPLNLSNSPGKWTRSLWTHCIRPFTRCNQNAASSGQLDDSQRYLFAIYGVWFILLTHNFLQ